MTLVCQVASSEGCGRPLEMKEATTEEDLFLRVLGAKAGCGTAFARSACRPTILRYPSQLSLLLPRM